MTVNYSLHKLLFYPLMLCLGFSSAFAQRKAITGTIHSCQGLPLEHALVKAIHNRQILASAISDGKGNFLMSLPTESSLLAVHLPGYKDDTIRVTQNRDTYHFILNERAEQINEVVVTGYVNKHKESYTGASFVIDSETLSKQVSTNLLDMIRNNVPGFELTANNIQGSNPNQIPDMILRGRSTFVEGDRTNLPLFILDGVETDVKTIFNLQPSTIRQVSVLKDAAATTYYGSKAANGVVVITSQPTVGGKLQVTYDGRYQLSSADLSSYQLLNAAEKLEYERMAGIYGDFKSKSKSDLERQKVYYEKLDRVKAGVNTSWLNMPLRRGIVHHHNLSFMGGTHLFRYQLMGGYSKTDGVMTNSSRNTASLYINLIYGDWSKFFLQYTGRLENTKSNDVPYGSFSDYALLNPYDIPYKATGELNDELSFGKANPLYEKSLSSYISNRDQTISNSLRMRWNIWKGLRLEGLAAMSVTDNRHESFFSPLSQRFNHLENLKRGSFDMMHSHYTDFSFNIFAVWNKGFGSRYQHRLHLTMGMNLQATEQNSDGYTAIGVLTDKADHVSMAATFAEGASPQGGKDMSRMLGGYLNVQYIYQNKYFLDASFRREGSSKFGSSQRYAPFGMLGLGWNIHKEHFLNDSFINLLKLRGSTGVVGSVNFHPYQAHLAYRYQPDLIYNNHIGAVPMALVNTHLKWERTIKRNVGIDFALFKDRLSGSIDAYLNTTHDLVMTVAKPGHTGFLNAKENLGKIQNSGFEFSLRGRIFNGNPVGMNAYLTLSHNRNRIVKISDYLRNHNAENIKQGNQRLPVPLYAEGESLTALKVMKSAGINPTNGKEVFIKKNGEQTYTYDYNERQVMGDTSPTVQGTSGFTTNWKDFSLSLTLGYRLGANVYNSTLATKVEGADPLTNVDRRVFYNRWRQMGDETRFKHIASQESTPPTSRFVDTEYTLEGTSLMLSYDIPASLYRMHPIKQIRVSLSMGQFFYLSTIKHERGLAYPFAHIYELSLNIKI